MFRLYKNTYMKSYQKIKNKQSIVLFHLFKRHDHATLNDSIHINQRRLVPQMAKYANYYGSINKIPNEGHCYGLTAVVLHSLCSAFLPTIDSSSKKDWNWLKTKFTTISAMQFQSPPKQDQLNEQEKIEEKELDDIIKVVSESQQMQPLRGYTFADTLNYVNQQLYTNQKITFKREYTLVTWLTTDNLNQKIEWPQRSSGKQIKNRPSAFQAIIPENKLAVVALGGHVVGFYRPPYKSSIYFYDSNQHQGVVEYSLAKIKNPYQVLFKARVPQREAFPIAFQVVGFNKPANYPSQSAIMEMPNTCLSTIFSAVQHNCVNSLSFILQAKFDDHDKNVIFFFVSESIVFAIKRNYQECLSLLIEYSNAHYSLAEREKMVRFVVDAGIDKNNSSLTRLITDVDCTHSFVGSL